MTTTGINSNATLINGVLNIPNYANNSWNFGGNNTGPTTYQLLGSTNYSPVLLAYNIQSGFFGRGNSAAYGYDSYKLDSSTYTFSNNTAMGNRALHSLGVGSANVSTNNTALGYNALGNATTGYGNVALGSYALSSNSISGNNTFRGNVGIGTQSLFSLKNGIQTVAIGDSAFKNLSSGNYNIALGAAAAWNQAALSPYPNNFFYISDSTYHLHMKLDSATGSAPNVIGKDGNGNWHVYQTPSTTGGTTYTLPIASASTLGGIKIGTGLSIDGNGIVNVSTTGWNTTGNTALSTDFLGPINDVNLTFKRNNQVVGLITGYSGGTQNVYWGDLVNTSGVSNVRIGSGAGTTVSNSGYSQNVIIGFTAGGMGSYNTGVGSNSLAGLNAVAFTTNYNVGLGYNSGTSLSNGTYNTMLGVNAGVTTINSLYTNSTALGANSTITKSNQIVLGDPNITQVLTYGNVLSKVKQQASDPTTTDIPDGFTAVYRNTTSGFTYLWANIGGTLLKVQLN
jgi:hypothetical protein